ncbi:MAG: SH3 domain-containing protein [Candidatus Orphnella occulta]|nr:SH3 domain-containing protein [Candidatus Orphnella occulta]
MLRTFFTIALFIAALFYIGGDSFSEEFRYDPYEDFTEASSLYGESRFQDAVNLYEGILIHGYESASLYYNLGNAYLKLGFLGSAVLNYERAKRFIPYDSDLKANLVYADSLRRQSPMEGNRLWLSRKINVFLDIFTINGLTLALSSIYLTIILLLSSIVFKKTMRRFISKFVIILGVMFMLVLTLMTINIYRIEHIHSAIVLADEINARFEPLESTAVNFRLDAGTKIIVLRTRDQWSQIKREDGKIGWIESSNYDII